MPTVTSGDGTRIAYQTHGSGPPLVLVHGDSASDYWDPVVPRFTDDHTVVTMDRRGRGDSGDTEPYDLEREVEDVLAVLDAVEGEPAVFGYSFGGLLAIEAARVAPVAALVAYEPAVLVGEYRERADLADRMAAALAADGPRAAMKLHVEEVIHGGDADDLDAWLAEWPPWPEYAGLVDTTLRMNREIETYRLPDELAVDAPALLLTGTGGPPHLDDSVRAVAEALPDGRLVEYEGVSHFGPTEAPGRISETVRTFLRQRARPSA
jgi:pimeloyl-ACP methyl ester carboxylesterase